jgi:uncharacterized membrane protein
MTKKHVSNLVWGIALVVVGFTILFLWRFIQVTNNELNKQIESITEPEKVTVFEPVELKSQKDFQMIGQRMFDGGGFEPGWNFKLNLAGSKFGLDMVSQYGEAKYLGYIDLVSQSTSTKIWQGKVLDLDDTPQDIKLEIISKKCTEPSGEEVDYTVKVKVADENLDGCAKLAI